MFCVGPFCTLFPANNFSRFDASPRWKHSKRRPVRVPQNHQYNAHVSADVLDYSWRVLIMETQTHLCKTYMCDMITGRELSRINKTYAYYDPFSYVLLLFPRRELGLTVWAYSNIITSSRLIMTLGMKRKNVIVEKKMILTTEKVLLMAERLSHALPQKLRFRRAQVWINLEFDGGSKNRRRMEGHESHTSLSRCGMVTVASDMRE